MAIDRPGLHFNLCISPTMPAAPLAICCAGATSISSVNVRMSCYWYLIGHCSVGQICHVALTPPHFPHISRRSSPGL